MPIGRRPLPASEPLDTGLPDKPGRVLRELFAPLPHLLVSGGDARLTIDPARGTNAYFCRPQPCPDTLEFASSTASSISVRGFDAAERARDALMQAAIADGIDAAFEARVEAMRGELRDILGLDSDVEVLFSASGTDAQLQALALGRAVLGAPLTTLVAASDQTGSGTVYTTRGRHFGERTANDCRVTKGEPLDGLDTRDSVALAMRDDCGALRSGEAIDAMVLEAVERVTATGGRVLLQAMDHSKLGIRAPGDAVLQSIAARWPQQVQIVIDACQMRLSRARIADYLGRGFLVLLTGSKYFAAPPFCGALLVPPRLAHPLADAPIDLTGLAAYNSRTDWPRNWTGARTQLPARPNFGQWLRWEIALGEIVAYYAVPNEFRYRALRTLGAGIARMIAASPYLALLPQPAPCEDARDEEMALPTIFGFTLERHGRPLTLDACKAIHRALAEPTAAKPAGQPLFARVACVLGQPVEWRDADGTSVAALRLCLSARHVIDAWSRDPIVAQANLERLLDQVSIVLIKIETLLRQPDDNATSEVSHGHCAR